LNHIGRNGKEIIEDFLIHKSKVNKNKNKNNII
jgi:hypothetical protein